MIPTIFKLFTLSLAFIIHIMLSGDLMSNSIGLAAYSLLLMGYLYAENRFLWKIKKKHFWINPVVLASIFTFALAFGISNVLFFLPEQVVGLVGVKPIATSWMNQLMLLVVFGAISMWVGYNSKFGYSLGLLLQSSRVLNKLILPSFCINRFVLFLCLAISLMGKLVAIKLGVYGYSSLYDQLLLASNYSQFLGLAGLLGKFALICVALQYFAIKNSNLFDRYLLWVVLGFEVFFGLLSGMKGAVVTPVIVVGLAYYSQRERFPRWFLPSLIVMLMFAYAVIQPFRIERRKSIHFDGSNIYSIITAMTTANDLYFDSRDERAFTGLKILNRLNLTYIGSLGIEYAANHKVLPAGSPSFLNNIVLAPVHAVVPRFLWKSKPLDTLGLWYTRQVVGYNYYSSTAMSSFTYLNFAGGTLAVILGFFLVGIFQRGLFDGLCHFGGGGLIVFFGLLGGLADINSAFNNFFIGIIRFFPILIVAQFMLLKRSRIQ